MYDYVHIIQAFAKHLDEPPVMACLSCRPGFITRGITCCACITRTIILCATICVLPQTFWNDVLGGNSFGAWAEIWERITLWSQLHKVIIVAELFHYNLHLVGLPGLQEQDRRAGKTLRVSVYRFQHTYKQEQGQNLDPNIQRCGMQVIRGRNPPPPPPSSWESKNQQEVSECSWTSTCLKLQTTASM